MKFKAKQIKPSEIIEVSPADGKHFTLAELRSFTESEWVEVIDCPGSSGAIMVVDEEGKGNGKPVNKLATMIWQEGCDPHSPRESDPIVGTALLCHESQIK